MAHQEKERGLLGMSSAKATSVAEERTRVSEKRTDAMIIRRTGVERVLAMLAVVLALMIILVGLRVYEILLLRDVGIAPEPDQWVDSMKPVEA